MELESVHEKSKQASLVWCMRVAYHAGDEGFSKIMKELEKEHGD